MDCIVEQLNAKGVSKKEIAELQVMREDLMDAAVSNGRTLEEASVIADEQVFEYAQNFNKDLNVAMRQVVANNNISKFLRQWGDRMGLGADQFLQSVQSRAQAVHHEFLSTLSPIIDQLAPKMFKGLQTKLDVANKIITIIDGDLSNPLAKGVNIALTSLRERYVAAGGFMGISKKPYVPFIFVKDAVLARYKDLSPEMMKIKFAEEILPRLDKEVSFEDMTDDEIIEVIMGSYDNIVSGGHKEELDLSKVNQRGRSFYKKRDQAKYFYAKDSKALGELYDMFGGGREKVVDNIFRYMTAMSKDIALMEKFGPNPDEGFKRMSAILENESLKQKGRVERFSDIFTGKGVTDITVSFAKAQYLTLRDANYSRSSNPIFAGAAAVKRVIGTNVLGGMFLSMLGDAGFVGLAARRYGGSFFTSSGLFFKELSLNMLPFLRGQSKEFLKSTGHTLDMFNALVDIEAREHVVNNNGKFMKTLNFLTFKVGGATMAAKSTRNSVSLDMANILAHEYKKPFDSIRPDLRDLLESVGMTPALWSGAVQKHNPSTQSFGSKFYDHSALRVDEKIPMELRYKAARAIDEASVVVMNMASNENNVIAKTLSSGGDVNKYAKPAAGAFFQLKSFTVSQMNYHLHPMLRKIFNEKGAQNKTIAAADVMAIASLFSLSGILINQISDISNGKTPEPIFDRKGNVEGEVLLRGFQRTGLGGFYADFGLGFQLGKRYGKNTGDLMFDFIFKDGVETGADTYDGIMSGLFAEDKKSRKKAFQKAGKAFVKGFYRFGIPKPWLLKPALEMDVKRAMMKFADSKEEKNFRRWEKRMKKESGQGYWYKGGGDVRPENILKAWEKDYENFQRGR